MLCAKSSHPFVIVTTTWPHRCAHFGHLNFNERGKKEGNKHFGLINLNRDCRKWMYACWFQCFQGPFSLVWHSNATCWIGSAKGRGRFGDWKTVNSFIFLKIFFLLKSFPPTWLHGSFNNFTWVANIEVKIGAKWIESFRKKSWVSKHGIEGKMCWGSKSKNLFYHFLLKFSRTKLNVAMKFWHEATRQMKHNWNYCMRIWMCCVESWNWRTNNLRPGKRPTRIWRWKWSLWDWN